MNFREFPYDFVEADQEIRRKNFPNAAYALEGYWVGPKKYFMLPSYKECAADIYNFEAKQDDVYVVGYVRTGTTLHCEMVWLIGNNLDYEAAQAELIDNRFPHLDFAAFKEDMAERKSIEDIKKAKGRRFIKAHLPISFLPPSIFENGAKVIYCARNPKDTIVSLYQVINFFQKDKPFQSFEEYFCMVKNNWGCFMPHIEHVKEAWERRNDKNFLFLFYEDTMKDKKGAIRKISDFLQKELTDKQVDQLCDHLDIQTFRKNKSVNLQHLVEAGQANATASFIWKGQPGGWREYFSGGLEKEVDEWIQKNLEGSDLKFPEP